MNPASRFSFRVIFSTIGFLFLFSKVAFSSQPIDFNKNAADNIDQRILLKHDPAVNKLVYSTQNHSNANYIRSQNCWAADLDLTCASPWNSNSVGKKAGTLITPRHVIQAAHYHLVVGDSIRFITNDNVVIRRKVISMKVNTDFSTNVPDICMLTLDSDVPPSIKPCTFLPANYSDYLSDNAYGLPVLFFDQEEKALVADIQVLNDLTFFRYYLKYPTNSNRLSLNETVISGDSGNPIFLVLNNQLVLIGVFTWGGAGSGNSLVHYANLNDGGTKPQQNLNDLIKECDAAVGINTGYKVSLFDFESTTALNEVIGNSSDMLVQCIGKEVIVRNMDKPSQIEVFDMSGHKIFSQNVSSNDFKFQLPSKGLYIVRIENETSRKIQKVLSY